MEHYHKHFLDMSNQQQLSIKRVQKFHFKLYSFIKYVKIMAKIEFEKSVV